jgi:preprotein translocase subunit SecE
MIKKFTQYIKDSIKELKKVVWPSRGEVIKKTGQVLFISLFVSLFLGVVDFTLSRVLENFVK